MYPRKPMVAEIMDWVNGYNSEPAPANTHPHNLHLGDPFQYYPPIIFFIYQMAFSQENAYIKAKCVFLVSPS